MNYNAHPPFERGLDNGDILERWVCLSENERTDLICAAICIITSLAELSRLQEHTMQSMLDCDFRAIFSNTLLDRIEVGCAKCETFYHCIGKNMTLDTIVSCLPMIEKECNASETRIIKTIRFNMQQAANLLEQYPNLLIVHLLRDPRAILTSRTLLKHVPDGVSDFPKFLCDDMRNNMIIYKSIAEKYKDRLSTLYYEDLAEDSVRIARLVYKRLSLNFTNSIIKWVEGVMLGEDVKGYSYLIERRNAEKSSNKWRLEIAYDLVQKVDEACKEFYQMTGFLPVINETMLRETGFKLRKKANVTNTIG